MRPQFQKMLADSEQQQFEYVIVYSIDRFARDDGDYGADKKILRSNGVKLLSATETIGTNADGSENLGGILTEGVLVAVAKYYSRELSKKVKRGQYESIQKKTTLGGAPLYGYTIKDKRITINPEQAEIVKTMFDMYSKGESAFDIANSLKYKGILNNKGNYFIPNCIMNMLKNKKYIGILKFGDYLIEDYYPAIIKKSTFDLVQEKISLNKRNPARLKAKETYLLSGKIFCGYCHTQIVGESGTSKNGTMHYYYKCNKRKKTKDCTKNIIPKNKLEDMVINYTYKHILNPQTQQDIISQILKEQEKRKNATELKLLQKELSQIQGYIDNLLKAIKQGIFSSSTQQELVKLEKQKEILEGKIIQLEHEEKLFVTCEMIAFWFQQFMNFDTDDEQTREYMITYFINKIILYDDKITIIYNNEKNNRTQLSIDELEEELCSDIVTLAGAK